MQRKLFKTGNSVVLSMPREALEVLDVSEGEVISMQLDREKHQLIIEPVEKPKASAGIDESFARQVSDFIERYHPALDELAKRPNIFAPSKSCLSIAG